MRKCWRKSRSRGNLRSRRKFNKWCWWILIEESTPTVSSTASSRRPSTSPNHPHEPPTNSASSPTSATAKLAGDSISLLYFKNYLRKAKSIETTAAVSDIGQHLLELVLITTGHVSKVSYKQLAKVADLKLTEDTKPFRHCMLLPKYRKIGPAELRLFSKVRVTVQLVKEVVTVTSVPPPLAQMQSKESSVEARVADFGSKKKNDEDDSFQFLGY
ncbi:uncharacterized protein LOC119769421 [Culex quinquefasciatus]|uniref:uncharacterized protein LOC119769421 n=1 Tax=Culex quinquefasciatus TaxID=7176 RepID=UPI0018E333ED|nr:uncharacterized protein LOC119769421 [Culex quinquefasciatus]